MAKPERSVFVIMPFVRVDGGQRDEVRLTAFFENNIKRTIESATNLQHQYSVSRSGEAFNITKEIIRALSAADIVVADLSGAQPNPNVMYELGVRLAVSDKPVILIKEQMSGAPNPFDVFAFFTKPYDPLDYQPLERHLIGKLERLETGEETFDNEVLRLIREELTRSQPDLSNISSSRQRELVLNGVRSLGDQLALAYGPLGLGVQGDPEAGPSRLLTRGSDIAKGLASANPFEREGIRLLGMAAEEMAAKVDDGTKVSMLIARAMLDAAESAATSVGSALAPQIESAAEWAVSSLRSELREVDGVSLRDVAHTAAKVESLPVDIESLLAKAGVDGVISLEDGDEVATVVQVREDYRVERGALHEDFLPESNGTRATLEAPLIAVYAGGITAMRELLPLLEIIAQAQRTLLLVATKVEGEAMATLRINVERGKLKCVPIEAPGFGDRRTDLLYDIAALTGARLLNPALGDRLEAIVLGDLGTASLVTAAKAWTDIVPDGGQQEAVAARATRLRAQLTDSEGEFAREQLIDRIASLVGRRVTIVVGGPTAAHRARTRRALLEALSATSVAREGGVVVGGVSVLARVAGRLRSTEIPGVSPQARSIVAAGLEAPVAALARSAGADPRTIIAALHDGGPMVFDARARQCVAPDQAPLVDPFPVLSRAISAATVVASTFLSTGTWRPRLEGA